MDKEVNIINVWVLENINFGIKFNHKQEILFYLEVGSITNMGPI